MGQINAFNENNKINQSKPSDRNIFQNDVSHDDITESPEESITENPLLSQQQGENAPLQNCTNNTSQSKKNKDNKWVYILGQTCQTCEQMRNFRHMR